MENAASERPTQTASARFRATAEANLAPSPHALVRICKSRHKAGQEFWLTDRFLKKKSPTGLGPRGSASNFPALKSWATIKRRSATHLQRLRQAAE